MTGLRAHQATVRRGGRTILHGVDFALVPGSVCAIVGPNGSGKSSLLRALAGIWPVASGEVVLDGRALADCRRREIAKRVTVVPQASLSEFDFTVHEIVAMGRYPHRLRFDSGTARDRDAVEHALESCAVNHLRNRPITQLSGGERQRVWIARSLAVEADYILLDEPTANLDVEHALEIYSLCRSMVSHGCAVAIATHDLNAVLCHAATVALLRDGHLVAFGATESVLTPAKIFELFHVHAEALTAANGATTYAFRERNQK